MWWVDIEDERGGQRLERSESRMVSLQVIDSIRSVPFPPIESTKDGVVVYDNETTWTLYPWHRVRAMGKDDG